MTDETTLLKHKVADFTKTQDEVSNKKFSFLWVKQASSNVNFNMYLIYNFCKQNLATVISNFVVSLINRRI